jgi:spore germination protein
VITINEDLAKQGILEHLIDLYIRDHQMRRGTHILISKGEAKKVFEEKLPLESMPDKSIEMISENYDRTLSMIPIRDVGFVSERVLGKRSYLIPRIVKHGKTDLKIAGAAIFMGIENRMIGWLGEEDVAGYNWVAGETKNGMIEVPYQDKGIFAFETLSMESVITYKRKDDQNTFHVKIKAEGTLGESWIHNLEIDDQKTILKLQKAVADKIKKQATHTINTMQKEYHADIFDFVQQVKQKEYDYWEKTRKEWDGKDGEFSKAEITVEAEVQIRHYMLNKSLDQ